MGKPYCRVSIVASPSIVKIFFEMETVKRKLTGFSTPWSLELAAGAESLPSFGGRHRYPR